MMFNVNHYVYVRLTDRGRQIHRERFEAVFAGTKIKYSAPVENADGWSKWQLWDLMNVFGEHVRLGVELPFECEIEIPG
jgi:hypothetical protein